LKRNRDCDYQQFAQERTITQKRKVHRNLLYQKPQGILGLKDFHHLQIF